MSGQPLPSPDLPAGTISVRVVRQSMGNNVAGQEVELRSGGAGETLVRTVRTDENGRALFPGVQTNMPYQAVARVDGESLVSKSFTLPDTGGIRLLLVAGLATATSAPATPAPPGTLALGSQSRFVIEHAEESIEVFVLLDLVNPLAGPVTLQSPLVFDLPPGSANGTVLQESAELAKDRESAGRRRRPDRVRHDHAAVRVSRSDRRRARRGAPGPADDGAAGHGHRAQTE